jgi:hypothetical protein
MTANEYEKVRAMTTYLKNVGVLDRKPMKVILDKAKSMVELNKHKELLDTVGN